MWARTAFMVGANLAVCPIFYSIFGVFIAINISAIFVNTCNALRVILIVKKVAVIYPGIAVILFADVNALAAKVAVMLFLRGWIARFAKHIFRAHHSTAFPVTPPSTGSFQQFLASEFFQFRQLSQSPQ
jgi:hypothetical protein